LLSFFRVILVIADALLKQCTLSVFIVAVDAEADEADVVYMPSIRFILRGICLTALVNCGGTGYPDPVLS